MKKANYIDKHLIVNILTRSFDSNLSVNYIIRQDRKREQHIRALMDYSFEVCHLFGNVFLSNDKKACALIVYPDRKKTTLKSIWLDLRLIFQCVGIGNILKTLKREKLINSAHPKIPFSYLWFIGVAPGDQNNGIGSQLLQSVLEYCDHQGRPVYLETSTVRNLPWYNKFDFQPYHEEDLTYHLYFFRREVKK